MEWVLMMLESADAADFYYEQQSVVEIYGVVQHRKVSRKVSKGWSACENVSVAWTGTLTLWQMANTFIYLLGFC